MKRVNLKTAPDVVRTLNRIANAVLNDEIGTQRANALIFACNSALAAIRAARQMGDADADMELHISIDYGDGADDQ